ncbi:MAG: NHL repeat-containing protein [Bacteroidota bacterium]
MFFLFFFFAVFLQDPVVRVEAILVDCKDAVSVSLATDGSLYLSDRGVNSIIQYSLGRTRSFGETGWGNDSFDNPSDICASFFLDIYVTDKNNNRIQRFDKNMVFIETIAKNSGYNIDSFRPQACAITYQGEIIILESESQRIVKLNPKNKESVEFTSYNKGPGAFRDLKDISISPDNNVIVLDRDRILIFDLFGNFARTISLEPGNNWKTIFSDHSRLFAVSSQKIVAFNFDGGLLFEITSSSIPGFPTDDFRDICASDSSLFILTAKELLHCSLLLN